MNQKKNLVIMCSGTGFTKDAIKFLADKIDEEDFDLIAAPGGIQSLIVSSRQSRHHQRSLEEQIIFLLEKHKLSRIIVLEHRNCAFFKELSEYDRSFFERSQDDVFRDAIEELKKIIPSNITIEIWYGDLEDKNVKFWQ